MTQEAGSALQKSFNRIDFEHKLMTWIICGLLLMMCAQWGAMIVRCVDQCLGCRVFHFAPVQRQHKGDSQGNRAAFREESGRLNRGYRMPVFAPKDFRKQRYHFLVDQSVVCQNVG